MARPGTLRFIGVTTVSIDKITQARLKRLAGDMAISAKVRELVEAAEASLPGASIQVPLPGQERLISPNTIASVKADTVELKAKVNSMALAVGFIAGFLDIKAKVEGQGELNLTTG